MPLIVRWPGRDRCRQTSRTSRSAASTSSRRLLEACGCRAAGRRSTASAFVPLLERRDTARTATRSSGTIRTTATRAASPAGAIRDRRLQADRVLRGRPPRAVRPGRTIEREHATSPTDEAELVERIGRRSWRPGARRSAAEMPTPNPDFTPRPAGRPTARSRCRPARPTSTA